MSRLVVNGKLHSVDVDPEMPLVLVLRERLGLTGTKVGCAHGACEACTVLIAGEAGQRIRRVPLRLVVADG